jgi:hypothetical protein
MTTLIFVTFWFHLKLHNIYLLVFVEFFFATTLTYHLNLLQGQELS